MTLSQGAADAAGGAGRVTGRRSVADQVQPALPRVPNVPAPTLPLAESSNAPAGVAQSIPLRAQVQAPAIGAHALQAMLAKMLVQMQLGMQTHIGELEDKMRTHMEAHISLVRQGQEAEEHSVALAQDAADRLAAEAAQREALARRERCAAHRHRGGKRRVEAEGAEGKDSKDP